MPVATELSKLEEIFTRRLTTSLHHAFKHQQGSKELAAAPNCLDFRFLRLPQCEKRENPLSCCWYLNGVDAGAFGGGTQEEGALMLISTFSCTDTAVHSEPS